MANREKTIEQRKKTKNLFNPLQDELDKPLSRSFKEGLGISAAILGPGKSDKIKKGIDKTKKLIPRLKKLFKHGESQTVKNLQKSQLSRTRKLKDSTAMERGLKKAKELDKKDKIPPSEKGFRRKLKSSVSERISDRTERTGLIPRNAKMLKAKKKSDSSARKALRSDLRSLGKIVGDKEAAKFTQSKLAKSTNVSRKAKPRNRIDK